MTADEIKLAISMHDVLDKYGFELNRKGYMSCPFHDEKTDSFKVYDNSFYCFGCGSGGDAIKFVRMLFKLDFSQTIAKLKYDFRFIDTCNLSYRQKQQLMLKQREIKSKQALLKAKKEL